MHETIISKKASFLGNGKGWNLKVATLSDTIGVVSLIVHFWPSHQKSETSRKSEHV